MRGPGTKALLAIAVALSLALPARALAAASDEPENYAVESASASLSSTLAGAHADLTVAFELSQSEGEPYGFTRDIEVQLPPGALGDPQRIQRCSTVQFGTSVESSECPLSSQVGVSEILLGGALAGAFTEPVYNMDPPSPDVVARLGFFAGPYPVTMNITVDPVDYGLVARIEGAPASAFLIGADTTLWGVPAASSHDRYRITPEEALHASGPPEGREAGVPPVPFMTNPTSCAAPGQVKVTATSYQLPGSPKSASGAFPRMVGCDGLRFQPSFSLAATNQQAAAPTGLEADLRMAQNEAANGRATSALRSAVVTLPPGFAINPAAGDGLAACSAAEVGFERDEAAHCPDAAEIGSAEVDVPPLEHVLHGTVYQRTPEPGHLFRFWLVADELGVHLKLPAEIEADPLTGQLTTRFDGIPVLGGNPQVPVSELKLRIFGGQRAPLATPSACGSYQGHYSFSPWSGQAAATGNAAMQIVSGCGTGGFDPRISAGTLDPSAGRFSPFVFELTRADGEANPSTLEVALPQGVLGKLAGVPLCPEDLAPSGGCPADSQLGTATVAAGVGGAPLWIPQPGRDPTAVYLAGPYNGAPYSLVIKVPAQAGPFDLGTVVTRAAIYVDPRSAQITIKSDPLPQILAGVPVPYRAIRVDVSRPQFTLNATGCEPQEVVTTATAATGAVATPSAGYQATNCAKLAFKPDLKLQLKGGTRRTKHPALRSVLTFPKKGAFANVEKAIVTLPHTELLDQAHVGNPCTRPQFAEKACPKISVLGRAKAWTPLLDKPLTGKVYFRANGGKRELPDIVADLHGPIHIELIGAVDTASPKRNARIRTTFFGVPDAPVSRFRLELKGGKEGLLVNSTNLCRSSERAVVHLLAHNGRRKKTRPKVADSCGKHRGKANARHSR